MAIDLDEKFCFAAKTSPGYLLRRASQLIVPRAEAVFADRDLTLSQWIALKLIREGLADTSATLSRLLGHNSGATTRMIDQFETRGWVTRNRRSADRRVVTLELTDDGYAAVVAMAPGMLGLWNSLLRDFSKTEVDTLTALLGRLVDRLEADDGG